MVLFFIRIERGAGMIFDMAHYIYAASGNLGKEWHQSIKD